MGIPTSVKSDSQWKRVRDREACPIGRIALFLLTPAESWVNRPRVNMDKLIGVNTVVGICVNMVFYRVNKVNLVADSIMRDQPKDELGRFVSPYDEPLSKKVVGVRLPQSIYERLLQLALQQSKSPGEVLRGLAVTALTQSKSQHRGVSEGRLEKTRDSEALLRSTDRVLKRLKLGKQASGYKAAVKALNMMIEELSSQDQ